MPPHQIIDFLRRRRFPMGTEKELQAAIEAELAKNGIPHTREHRLTERDIPDFSFAGGVFLEAKIKGSARAIHAQLARYCEHEEVRAIILATNVAMGLPPEINGKPAYLVSLGRAWL